MLSTMSSQAADLVQIEAAELDYLRETVAEAKKLRDKAAALLAHLCDLNPRLPLDTAWMIGELSDAVTEYDGD
jgi:arginine exporter protein ArgO